MTDLGMSMISVCIKELLEPMLMKPYERMVTLVI